MSRAFGEGPALARSTALVGLLVLATYGSILAADPTNRRWSQSTELAIQLLLPAALASSIFLLIAYRLYRRSGVAWFAAATTMIGIQGLPTLVAPASTAPPSEAVLLWSAVALGLAMVALVRIAEARHVDVAPIPLGIAFGTGLVLVRGLGEQFWSGSALSSPAAGSGSALLALVGAALAAIVWRQSCLPARSRAALAGAVLSWSIAGALHALGLTDNPAFSIAATACALSTCVLVTSTALELLGQAARDEEVAIQQLQQQLLVLRTRAREGVEQLHEVKGTIAGIASATELIRQESRLSGPHRAHLADMLAHETARLQRLVHAGPRHSTTTVDLDDVVRPLLTARHVVGQQVTWDGSDARVEADADELTEVLNILLNNAAEHAPGAAVRIFTRQHEDSIELVVADDGPGVPAGLRTRIFDWGYSSPGSSGQGVGLAMAQRLMARRDVVLRLDAGHQGGAAFVLHLAPVGQRSPTREAAVLAR